MIDISGLDAYKFQHWIRAGRIDRFPGRTYVNWSASLGLPTPAGELQLYTTINNVLDQDPPKFALVAMAQGGTPYPVLGRYYRVGMRYSF